MDVDPGAILPPAFRPIIRHCRLPPSRRERERIWNVPCSLPQRCAPYQRLQLDPLRLRPDLPASTLCIVTAMAVAPRRPRDESTTRGHLSPLQNAARRSWRHCRPQDRRRGCVHPPAAAAPTNTAGTTGVSRRSAAAEGSLGCSAAKVSSCIKVISFAGPPDSGRLGSGRRRFVLPRSGRVFSSLNLKERPHGERYGQMVQP